MQTPQKIVKVSLFLVLSLALFGLSACGYKPSTHYAKKIISEKVYTQVEVSLSDPENSVLIKDALNRALQTRLKRVVTRKKDAKSKIALSYRNIHFIPLQYDKNGYIVYYQAVISLSFTFENSNLKKERNIIGRFEFPIRPSAIISNDLRLKAIEKGSLKALDEFISYLSVQGVFKDEGK